MNSIQVPLDGGRKISVLGIPLVIRIHGHDTNGVLSVVESHDVKGHDGRGITARFLISVLAL